MTALSDEQPREEPVEGVGTEPVARTAAEPVGGATAGSVDGTGTEPVQGTTSEPVQGTTSEPTTGTAGEPGDETSAESVEASGGAPPADSARLPRLRHPHARGFRAVLAVLGLIAAAAIAVAVVVGLRGRSGNGTVAAGVWSSWAPSSSGSEGVSEIADFIAPYYRLDSSQQLDVVTPIKVAQATAAGTTTGNGLTVAVNVSGSSVTSSSNLDLLNGETIAYNVCGLGPSDCELAGKASTTRMLLLRREALELALYTLKYISGSENVLTVLPPGHTKATSKAAASKVTVAVLFDRAELKPWLDVPLSKTLAAYPPSQSELPLWSQSDEAGLVDELTGHGLFSSQMEAQQEGGKLMVLTPLPTQ